MKPSGKNKFEELIEINVSDVVRYNSKTIGLVLAKDTCHVLIFTNNAGKLCTTKNGLTKKDLKEKEVDELLLRHLLGDMY